MLLGSVPLGVLNEVNLEHSRNIWEASVRLLESSAFHDFNPKQPVNIAEAFVILLGSATLHEANPTQLANILEASVRVGISDLNVVKCSQLANIVEPSTRLGISASKTSIGPQANGLLSTFCKQGRSEYHSFGPSSPPKAYNDVVCKERKLSSTVVPSTNGGFSLFQWVISAALYFTGSLSYASSPSFYHS